MRVIRVSDLVGAAGDLCMGYQEFGNWSPDFEELGVNDIGEPLPDDGSELSERAKEVALTEQLLAEQTYVPPKRLTLGGLRR